MKNYRRPSLKAVATFEAAARHESFKGAAEELFLTPSAISHQVRQLEEHLAVNLFHRLSGGLTITDAGAAYLRMLSPAFLGIDDATRQVMELEYSDQLTIRTAPSFAKRWLLDRLPDFLQRYPDIDVKVIATSEILDFRKQNIDIGIYYGQSIWPGHVARALLSEHIQPMCSPDYKKQAGNLTTPSDLLEHTLIHTERNLVSWKMWLADRGVALTEELRGVCLDPSALAIEAAVRGNGVVLESDMLACEELTNGTLIPAIKDCESEIISYYLVYPESNTKVPKILAFTDWISNMAGTNPTE